MTKVVYNACYGGFGLSKEACQRYWEIKGQQVWIECDREYESLGIFTVWLVSPDRRLKVKNTKEFCAMSMDERIAYNEEYEKQTWSYYSVDRHDPVLVQVVEELGDKANTQYSKLSIEEVYGQYRINEYDGLESVETSGSINWITP